MIWGVFLFDMKASKNRFFTSKEVLELTGLTYRQLVYLKEKKYISSLPGNLYTYKDLFFGKFYAGASGTKKIGSLIDASIKDSEIDVFKDYLLHFDVVVFDNNNYEMSLFFTLDSLEQNKLLFEANIDFEREYIPKFSLTLPDIRYPLDKKLMFCLANAGLINLSRMRQNIEKRCKELKIDESKLAS